MDDLLALARRPELLPDAGHPECPGSGRGEDRVAKQRARRALLQKHLEQGALDILRPDQLVQRRRRMGALGISVAEGIGGADDDDRKLWTRDRIEGDDASGSTSRKGAVSGNRCRMSGHHRGMRRMIPVIMGMSGIEGCSDVRIGRHRDIMRDERDRKHDTDDRPSPHRANACSVVFPSHHAPIGSLSTPPGERASDRTYARRFSRRRSCALSATTIVETLISTAPMAGASTNPSGARIPAASGIATTLYPAAQARFCTIFR